LAFGLGKFGNREYNYSCVQKSPYSSKVLTKQGLQTPTLFKGGLGGINETASQPGFFFDFVDAYHNFCTFGMEKNGRTIKNLCRINPQH